MVLTASRDAVSLKCGLVNCVRLEMPVMMVRVAMTTVVMAL